MHTYSSFTASELAEITGLMSRYCRYLDQKEWGALRAIFTDDARFEGLWAAADSPDEFVSRLQSNLGSGGITIHHALLPDIVRVSDDVARGTWAMHDYLRWEAGTRKYMGIGPDGQSGIRGYGFYDHEYRLTEDGWKISFLRLSRMRIDPLTDSSDTPDYPYLQPSIGWVEGATHV